MSTAERTPIPASTTRSAPASRLLADAPMLVLRYGMVALLVAMAAVTAGLDSSFLDRANLLNLLLQWAPVGLMAIGMTFVIISGGFDLSVGGIYAGATVLFAGIASHHNTWLALVATLAAGAGVGALNGFVITRLDVNPFVATLGAGLILRGFALVGTNATPILVSKPDFAKLGQGKLGPFPVPAVLLVLLLAVAALVLARTAYGRSIYAIGGNDEAARLAGLRTRTLRASTYVLTGLGAALAGMILASRLGSGQADVGPNIELQVITVVVVGGTALAGGEGAIWRTAVGISILAILGNAFDRLQVSPFWQQIIQGAIIVFAIAVDSYSKRRAGRESRLARTRGRHAEPGDPH